jgi:hypothetical protein
VTAGYDEVTGLGSLDVANFLNAWINTATATPVFNPAAGTYTSKQNVTISDATSGAAIYDTIDGTVPTTSSAKYTAAISVSSTETIKAIAMSSGSITSAMASATVQVCSRFLLELLDRLSSCSRQLLCPIPEMALSWLSLPASINYSIPLGE